MRGLADLFTFIGLPTVASAVLAILIAESAPLTLSELSRRTGYAKSHLSTHLKHLVFQGLVGVVKRGKTYLYYARREAVSHLVMKHLEELKLRIELAVSELRETEIAYSLVNIRDKLLEIVSATRKNRVVDMISRR